MKKQLKQLFGKSISFVLAFLLLFQTDFSLNAKQRVFADVIKFTEGDFTYAVDSGYAYVIDCNTNKIASMGGKVVIPSTVRGYTVRGIGNCQKMALVAMLAGTISGVVTEVELPQTCVYIGDYAFAGAATLESIEIPSKTNYIGKQAFSLCPELDVVFYSTKCQIADNAFDKTYTGTIYCEPGSDAEIYAKEHGFQYASLDDWYEVCRTGTKPPGAVTVTTPQTTKAPVQTTKATPQTTQAPVQTTRTTTTSNTQSYDQTFVPHDVIDKCTDIDRTQNNVICAGRFECRAGDIIDFPVYIYNNTGYGPAGIRLVYDAAVNPLISSNEKYATPGEASDSLSVYPTWTPERYSVSFGTMSQKNELDSGIIFTARIQVPSDSEPGTIYPMKVEIDKFLDKDNMPVKYTLYDGWIRITDGTDYIVTGKAPQTTTTRAATTQYVRTIKTTTTTTTTTPAVTTTMRPALQLNTDSITLTNGEQFTVSANRDDVTFRSNNPDAVIVSQNGIITAVGVGQAVISVYDSESNAVQITVEVKPVSTQSGPLRGDVNSDGTVSVEDAQLTLRAYTQRIAGNEMGLSETQIKAADITGDGELSVDDAQYILRYYTEKYVAGKDTLTWDDLLKKTG